MPSSAACIARAQASTVCQSLNRYRNTLPTNTLPNSVDPLCRADGWHIGTELLNGDFDLDSALAAQLIGSMLAVDAQPAPQNQSNTSWMMEYLYGSPGGAPGTAERFISEARGAAIGPGGLLANLNAGVSAAHAGHAARLEKSIQTGAQRILSGQSKSVRINAYVTLYNGNTSGKGRPRPKIRITNMPIETVQPALLGQNGKVNLRTQVASGAIKNANLRELAPKVSPLARVYIRGGVGAGVLTFGPSAVLDLADAIRRDTNGKLKFDARRFAISSARSQSGNLVGFGVSLATSAVAVGLFGLAATGAPVILVSFGLGFFAQIAWGALDMGNRSASLVQERMER